MSDRAIASLLFLLSFSGSVLGQDWWTKTKREAIPPDLTKTMLLVEKFKTRKVDEAPVQAYADKENTAEHPLLRKTNDNLEVYNEELKEIFKAYKFSYEVASEKRCEDSLKYPYSQAKYVLKHEVYLRRFQKDGVNDFFYTYVFYFYERETKKSYPYIFLFEEKRLKSVEVLITYLNKL